MLLWRFTSKKERKINAERKPTELLTSGELASLEKYPPSAATLTAAYKEKFKLDTSEEVSAEDLQTIGSFSLALFSITKARRSYLTVAAYTFSVNVLVLISSLISFNAGFISNTHAAVLIILALIFQRAAMASWGKRLEHEVLDKIKALEIPPLLLPLGDCRTDFESILQKSKT